MASQDFNKNTSWFTARIYPIYVAFFAIPVLLLLSWGVRPEIAWTSINMLHFVITFFFFHGVKGTPMSGEDTDFKYDNLTFWEQLDNGDQYTPRKKFLTAAPVILFLLTSHYTQYDESLFIANLAVCIVLVIAKTSYMYRKRLL